MQFACQKDNANYAGKAETMSTIVDYFGDTLKFTAPFRSAKIPLLALSTAIREGRWKIVGGKVIRIASVLAWCTDGRGQGTLLSPGGAMPDRNGEEF